MSHSAKRFVSLCLALVLTVGLLVMPGSAAKVKHYDTYTVLGDSIAAGYGLASYPVPEPDILDGTRVAGSYADLLGKAVECGTYYNMAHCGNRAVDVDFLLSDEATGDDLTPYLLASAMNLDMNTEEDFAAAYKVFQQLRADTQKAVSEADLITLNVGNNDTLTYALVMWGIEAATKSANSNETLERYKEYLMKVPGVGDVLTGLNSITSMADMLQTLLKYALQGLESFKTNWDKCIADIRKLNPDATIVAVGMYNPFNEVTLTNNSALPIGRLASTMVLPLNLYMQFQSNMRSEYIFVDVRDPEVHDMPSLLDESGTLTGFIDGLRHGTHPNENGHAFMAEKIIAALPTEDAPEVTPSPSPEVPAPPAPDNTPDPVKVFPFRDVASSAWYYPNVYYVWDHNIMEGMDTLTFAPESTTTRAQFATVIYRMADSPTISDAHRALCPFTDLAADWYKDAVVWCYLNGVVNGTSNTTFTPNTNITREQMVSMLYRYSKETAANPTVLTQFTDASAISDYAVPAVIWAVENSIVNGMGDGTFSPRGNSTRAQLAAVLSRYMARSK